MTTVKSCKCSHEFQDATYGKDKRVMNKTDKKQGTNDVYRCTVCNKEHAQ